MFKNTLILVNGNDQPQQYDGTTVSDATYTGTGITDNDFIHVNVFKQRLFFVPKDELSLVYMDSVGAITGAATKLDLGDLCRKGGFTLFTATWTRDGGDGMDDYFAIFTSMGEVLIYNGDYPGGTWQLQGRYEIPPPIGRRAAVQTGSDVTIITDRGWVPISEDRDWETPL